MAVAYGERGKAAIRLGVQAARSAGLTPLEVEGAVAIGWRESFLGMFGQFVLPDGTPSFNWGATTARDKSIPSFGGHDLNEGKPITQRWAGPWGTMRKGFDYWRWHFWGVRQAFAEGAFARGDDLRIATLLKDSGYYGGAPGLTREEKIADYAALIRGGRKDVREALSGEFGRVAIGTAALGALWAGWRFYTTGRIFA